jgi:hypothetical protein
MAYGKSPYGSSTLASAAGVTHKVIHKKCVELLGTERRIFTTRTYVLKIYAWKVFLYESNTWGDLDGLAHNIIHRSCAEVQPGTLGPCIRDDNQKFMIQGLLKF